MVEREGVSTMVGEIQRSVMWYGPGEIQYQISNILSEQDLPLGSTKVTGSHT